MSRCRLSLQAVVSVSVCGMGMIVRGVLLVLRGRVGNLPSLSVTTNAAPRSLSFVSSPWTVYRLRMSSSRFMPAIILGV